MYFCFFIGGYSDRIVYIFFHVFLCLFYIFVYVFPPTPPALDTALRLRRDSGPLRCLARRGSAGPSARLLGWGRGRRVTVRGPDGATFAICFGARNQLRAARYAHFEGLDCLPLVAAYVPETGNRLSDARRDEAGAPDISSIAMCLVFSAAAHVSEPLALPP